MDNKFKWDDKPRIKALKLKILGIELATRPVMVKDTKPDKRFLRGYRYTGVKSPKITVDTTLIVSYTPKIRLGQTLHVAGFGQMRCVDMKRMDLGGDLRLKNCEWLFQDNYNLSFAVDEYIDVLPLGFIAGESSKQIK